MVSIHVWNFRLPEVLPVHSSLSQHGQTALMSAAYKSKPRVVRTLMKRGADPDLWSRVRV